MPKHVALPSIPNKVAWAFEGSRREIGVVEADSFNDLPYRYGWHFSSFSPSVISSPKRHSPLCRPSPFPPYPSLSPIFSVCHSNIPGTASRVCILSYASLHCQGSCQVSKTPHHGVCNTYRLTLISTGRTGQDRTERNAVTSVRYLEFS